MGAHAAGLNFEAFDNWSAQGASYHPITARDAWKSFKPDGGINAGTLYGIAKDCGWTDNGQPKAWTPPTRKPVELKHKPKPGMSATEVFNRCQQATPDHSYIVKKGAELDAPLDDLRVVPEGDPLVIMGESMVGALVVPAYAPDGSLQSLQCITVGDTAKQLGTRNKPNLPGSPMSGAMHVVGTITPGQPVFTCEGIGTAWSVWQATGHAAVVTFGWGNTEKVVATLRQKDSTARIVICPDVGKEGDAEKIAALHHCGVARMPDGEANNFDANDLAQRDGLGALEMILLDAVPPAPQPLLKPVSVFDVLTNPSPPPAFAWDGYLPHGEVSLLGAHGGTGKSMIALMLSVCAALGRPLFGVDTEQSNILFASFEDGTNRVRNRLADICKTWAINPADLEGKLHIVDGTVNPELFTADSRSAGDTTATYAELCRLVKSTQAGLVIIDNASDAFGGDEINRRQVRAFMRTLAQVARLTDCAVLLLAHVDKGTSRTKKPEGNEAYSGSTAWHNSARSRLFMSRTDSNLLTLEHHKNNLGKKRDPLTLTWPDDGLPYVMSAGSDFAPQQGRADDAAAAGLLRIIAEFESRGQFCSPAITSPRKVYSTLKSEPAFIALKLRSDDTNRILNQCQRAGWLEPLEYRTPDRKPHERWTLTTDGRLFAGLPAAPTAPTAPTIEDGASENMALGGAPTAPTPRGGVGGRARTQDGAQKAIQH